MTRILVVDDDATVSMAIELCLKRKGFEVVAADGRDTGLHAVDSTKFDLMLVDVFMPHMRGSDAIRIFHERAPATPLIAMSGYAFANLGSPNPDFLKVAFEHGAAGCLRKPFTPATLLAAIDTCLGEPATAGQFFCGETSHARQFKAKKPMPDSVNITSVRQTIRGDLRVCTGTEINALSMREPANSPRHTRR